VIESVSDRGDPRLHDYGNVPDGELLARRGLFVAEGRLVVTRLLTESRFATRSVMVTAAAHRALHDVLAARPDVPVYVVPQATMDGIAGFPIHRGCLALGERPPDRPWPDAVAHARTLVLLERVGNADNVGGVFRNAAALGGDAILLDPASTDPLYRKAIRTSMGAALQVPFARLAPWPQTLTALREMGFALVALTPAPVQRTSDAPSAVVSVAAAVRTTQSRRVAFVLGHEGEGLSDEVRTACDVRACIPMSAKSDSLNIATACGIALYERSRSAYDGPRCST
jgi:tRNA G18 (ribose-2'-O)-methylase SpoU